MQYERGLMIDSPPRCRRLSPAPRASNVFRDGSWVPLRFTPGRGPQPSISAGVRDFMLTPASRARAMIRFDPTISRSCYPDRVQSVRSRRILRDACGRAVSLPASDAYAQLRRLQPVLRASETAAPPASVPKAPAAWVVSVRSHSPQRPERHREKPGIEEQHNTLRLTRITLFVMSTARSPVSTFSCTVSPQHHIVDSELNRKNRRPDHSDSLRWRRALAAKGLPARRELNL